MSKHSPAPWTGSELGRMSRHYVEGPERGGRRLRIAFVYADKSRMFVGESLANTRLIAESPVMHELLTTLDAQMTERHGDEWLTDPLCVKIREALARIDGE